MSYTAGAILEHASYFLGGGGGGGGGGGAGGGEVGGGILRSKVSPVIHSGSPVHSLQTPVSVCLTHQPAAVATHLYVARVVGTELHKVCCKTCQTLLPRLY